jgi:predicted ribosomally synthesized peptide with SipW-like signal peptide
MKKLFLRLSLIGGVVALLTGGTVAYFQDKETSSNNKFTAGKFNLQVGSQCTYNGQVQNNCNWITLKDLTNELFFNFADIKPGDYGENTVNLKVDNNDAWMCAEIANLVSDDNGCESPENKLDTTCGPGQGELQDNLFLTVWKDTDCDNQLDKAGGLCVTSDPGFDPGCGTVNDEEICNTSRPPGEPNHILCHWVDGQATEQVLVDNQPARAGLWPIADSTTGTGPLAGGQSSCLGVSWKVPIETTNIIQTDSLVGDVIFNAVQSRHTENFRCSDLYTEVCDGKDNNYNGQTDEGPLWINKGQPCSAGVGACQASGTYICNAGNPTGPTICSATAGTPGEEICGDGLDNNCNGQVDEGCQVCGNGIVEGTEQCDDGNQSNFDFCSTSCTTIPDKDQDGYAGDDCNDNNAAIHPGAAEVCNLKDDNCDGRIDEGLFGVCRTNNLGWPVGWYICSGGQLVCP